MNQNGFMDAQLSFRTARTDVELAQRLAELLRAEAGVTISLSAIHRAVYRRGLEALAAKHQVPA